MNTSFELQEDGVIVMNVAGEVDVFAAAEFKDGLFRCLDQGARRLIIDMTGSCFIDSTGLGVLVAGAKHARGSEMAIVCDEATLGRIFAIVGLDKVFSVYTDRCAALRGAPL
jgi:anti-sigma B factor antagonist